MKHTLFARFGSRREAEVALAGVAALGSGARAPHVHMHAGARDSAQFEEQIAHSGVIGETDLRHALVLGSALGLVTGAMLGLILTAVLAIVDSMPLGALFGALIGLAVGLLMMTLVGSGLTDRALKRLTRDLQAGEVVVTVETRDRKTERRVEQILNKAGGLVSEKPVT